MSNKAVFGIIGLGTMGRNLLLNIADKRFAVSGLDKDGAKVSALLKEAGNLDVSGFNEVKAFIGSLRTPRALLILVPAGKIVDDVIAEVSPLLSDGDLIIDGGNSHFSDTNRRFQELKSRNIHFFGMGISGGEEGARNGPSLMPGGNPEAYTVVKPVLEAIAAKVNGEPCVDYVGAGASGHFVKMVHNGIEYGIMQLIAESYEYLKRGAGLSDDAIQHAFASWNGGRLQSFLLEITADIFAFREPGAKDLLVNQIKDEARSKGTGKWTSQVAMDLQVPLTVIDAAVSMRDLSKYKSLRVALAARYPAANRGDSVAAGLDDVEAALYFSTIVAYAQGMHLLAQASREYNFGLRLERIAAIWRGGCIIRSAFLEDMRGAYERDPSLPHLFADPAIAAKVSSLLPSTRKVVSTALSNGIAIPALTASVSYFDAIRSERMPANVIQAQRDYFGAHTYEKIGFEGVFHTQWNR